MRMARLNVYVPDELASRVREAEINVSAVTSAALEEELGGRAIERLAGRAEEAPAPPGSVMIEVVAALDDARDEIGPSVTGRSSSMHRRGSIC